jgi:hypothetical protein
VLVVRRGKTSVFVNWREEEVEVPIEREVELVSNYNRKDPVLTKELIRLCPKSCCVVEEKC